MPRKLPGRIGWGLWFTILSSFIILATAVAFLSWLWFVDRQDKSWRRVMLSERSTQAITLMGVLIRFAIASLGAITTSMLASIAVERHGVPSSMVVEVSIARFTNNGPQSFWKHVLSGTTFRFWLRATLTVLLLLMVASQFTSTLLVTDLRDIRVGSFHQNLSYGFNFETPKTPVSTPLPLIGSAFNYYFIKPSSSEIFAEHSEPGSTGEDIDDTGITVRAFLPIPLQSERETLKSFQGMARVIESRVFCVRPEFSGRFCPQPDTATASYKDFICGNITADLSNMPPHDWYASYEGDKRQFSATFECPILDVTMYFPGQQKWLLCRVWGGLLLASSLTNTTSVKNSTAFGGTSWLLIDTGSLCDVDSVTPKDWSSNTTWERISSAGSGPWLRQWSQAEAEDNGTTAYQLKMSLCFDYQGAALVDNLNITASTTSNHTEPVFRYDPETNQYDTSAVRHQLGVTERNGTKNNTEREILTITKEDMQTSLDQIRWKPLRPPYKNEIGDWLFNFLWLPLDTSLAICPICSPDIAALQTVDSLLSQVFTDILNTTDSPALAIQALNTLIYRLTYYYHISAFSPAAENAIISRFDLVQAPQERMGLVAVLVIIGGNVLLFVLVILFFFEATTYSFLQNGWHTVAQLSQSEEARPLLERATLAADKDMDCWLDGRTPPEGISENVKDFFLDIGRLFTTKEMLDQERLSVKNGVFARNSPG